MDSWSDQYNVRLYTAQRNHTHETPQYLVFMPARPLNVPLNLDRHELLEFKIQVSKEPWEPFLMSRQAKHHRELVFTPKSPQEESPKRWTRQSITCRATSRWSPPAR